MLYISALMDVFKIKGEFKPAGDQPKAIKKLIKGFKEGLRYQTLLGVTGSGKTFTVANLIEKIGKPTLWPLNLHKSIVNFSQTTLCIILSLTTTTINQKHICQ